MSEPFKSPNSKKNSPSNMNSPTAMINECEDRFLQIESELEDLRSSIKDEVDDVSIPYDRSTTSSFDYEQELYGGQDLQGQQEHQQQQNQQPHPQQEQEQQKEEEADQALVPSSRDLEDVPGPAEIVSCDYETELGRGKQQQQQQQLETGRHVILPSGRILVDDVQGPAEVVSYPPRSGRDLDDVQGPAEVISYSSPTRVRNTIGNATTTARRRVPGGRIIARIGFPDDQPSIQEQSVVLPNPEEMTEEEMLALVMQQSLAEYEEKERNQNNEDNNNNNGAPMPATKEVEERIQNVEEPIDIDFPLESPILDTLRQTECVEVTTPPTSTHRPRERSRSPMSTGNVQTPLASPAPARRLMKDVEFSQRHLDAIETTAVEIETPTTIKSTYRLRKSPSGDRLKNSTPLAGTGQRRRLPSGGVSPSSSGHNRRSVSPSRSPLNRGVVSAPVRRRNSIEVDEEGTSEANEYRSISNPRCESVPGAHHVSSVEQDQGIEDPTRVACRRRMLMDRASENLSSREVTEIEQALREADEAEYIDASFTPASPTRPIRQFRAGGPGRGRGNMLLRSYSASPSTTAQTRGGPGRGLERSLSLDISVVAPPPLPPSRNRSSSGRVALGGFSESLPENGNSDSVMPTAAAVRADSSVPNLSATVAAAAASVHDGAISAEEAASIEAALREADALEAAKQEAYAKAEMESMLLAERMQAEAAREEEASKAEMESMMLAQQMQIEAFIQAGQQRLSESTTQQQFPASVRNMTRAQLEYESERVSRGARSGTSLSGNHVVGAMHASHPPQLHPLEVEPALRSLYPTSPNTTRTEGTTTRPRPITPIDQHPVENNLIDAVVEDPGSRRGSDASAYPPAQWSEGDRNSFSNGPHGGIQPRYDSVVLQGQRSTGDFSANDDMSDSFKKNTTTRSANKDVATQGIGRRGSDTDARKGKAMDPHVRLQISRAIQNGLIDRCNGVVKQGKEAMVYHANEGTGSHGFDVAVKVFRRLQDFRSRADYVDGDPRFLGRSFHDATEREQLEVWTEKEYRNLVRANRAMVPVPSPLYYKENILFMRFIGNNGWPAPQIRDLEIRNGDLKWEMLYSQVMESIRR